jgi:hypothetical protein
MMILQRPPTPERPFTILRLVEEAIRKPIRAKDKLEGPCGKPPLVMHRWPPRRHKKRVGNFTLKARYCLDCGLFEGVLY